MNYWSGLKAPRPLLVWFDCIFLRIFFRGASQIWFCLLQTLHIFFVRPVQNNYLSRIESVQHVAVGHLWANNISKDLLTPSCLDMCLIYRLDFLHPLGQLLPPYVCVCAFCSAERSQLRGCVCQMTPRQNACHMAPLPLPASADWLGLTVVGVSRGSGEERKAEGAWEVLTMRECLHHDPSISLHTVLSMLNWDWSLLL